MRKSNKILLSCVCIAFVFAMLGFGVARMTDTTPVEDKDQTIHTGDTGNKTGDAIPESNLDAAQGVGDGVEVRFRDGSVYTLIIDPSVTGGFDGWDFDWDDYDFGMTGGHE